MTREPWPHEIPARQVWLELDVESVETATTVLDAGGYRMFVKNAREDLAHVQR
ncbi:MAG TPA: hypothetical protein VK841_16590 [Polyangiaceae bacterium]|jgi:hypothetical protein|nr:hypothetical protein [Polyangiaceae bacterium]